MARLEIRTMRAEDLDEKVDVHVQTWFETYEGLVPDAWSRENITPEKMRALQLQRGFERTFVACLDGRIVGFASFEPVARAFVGRSDVSEVSSIYVLREFQGTGAGGALLEAALGSCPNDDVVLFVLEGNDQAIGFYEHLGFERTGRRVDDGPMRDLEMLLRRGEDSK